VRATYSFLARKVFCRRY